MVNALSGSTEKRAKKRNFCGFVTCCVSGVPKSQKYKPYILKYKALILKYVPCVFCEMPYVFLQCGEKSGKSPGFRLENGGVRRENAIAFTVAPLRFPEIGKRTLLSGCVFCLEGKGVHAHLLLHGQQAVAACGREVVAQSYLVNEIKIRVENFIGSMSRQNTYE